MPVNRARVLVQVRRSGGSPVPMQIGTVRGALPQPGPLDVELLRLEYLLPPALKQQAAERSTRKALLTVAAKMNLPEPPPHQLRQVQTVHGALVALLGVRVAAWQRLRRAVPPSVLDGAHRAGPGPLQVHAPVGAGPG